MREKIDIAEAVRLYDIFRSWREVAAHLSRNTTAPFTADAVSSAVRRSDRRAA